MTEPKLPVWLETLTRWNWYGHNYIRLADVRAAWQAQELTTRQLEARAILLTELLRYTAHRDGCTFHAEHWTHCKKWAGFRESRYLDQTQSCTCGANAPCSCGLHQAQRAIGDVLLPDPPAEGRAAGEDE